MTKLIDLSKYRCGMDLYTTYRGMWRCEIADKVFGVTQQGSQEKGSGAVSDKTIGEFLQVIEGTPIEKLISGQAYHDKRKKLIAIVVKPIKTTFITSYYMRSTEGTILFPGYKDWTVKKEWVQPDILTCQCGCEDLHLVATLEFKCNDYYQSDSVVVNGKHDLRFIYPIRYQYRSQGNIHLLFAGECGHYTTKSFDGHKGPMYLNANTLVDELRNYLNLTIEGNPTDFDYALLGKIERFFLIKSETAMGLRP